MRIHEKLILHRLLPFAFGVAAGSASPAMAEKLPAGAQPVNDSQYVELLAGKTVSGVAYKDNGSRLGTYKTRYKADGRKLLTWKPYGGGPTRNFAVRWEIRDGLFCEQGVPSGTMRCGARGLVYRKGGTCFHTFSDKKTVRFKYGC
jgi:hypothetical protein